MSYAPRLLCPACERPIPSADVDGPSVECRRCGYMAGLEEVMPDA